MALDGWNLLVENYKEGGECVSNASNRRPALLRQRCNKTLITVGAGGILISK